MELPNGKRVAKFTLSTKETYFNEEGETKNKSQWHQLTAWGKWVQVLEQLNTENANLAIEGKLISRFYTNNGKRKLVSEVEINDMIFLA
jgi:single-strand DNA-binding protein